MKFCIDKTEDYLNDSCLGRCWRCAAEEVALIITAAADGCEAAQAAGKEEE